MADRQLTVEIFGGPRLADGYVVSLFLTRTVTDAVKPTVSTVLTVGGRANRGITGRSVVCSCSDIFFAQRQGRLPLLRVIFFLHGYQYHPQWDYFLVLHTRPYNFRVVRFQVLDPRPLDPQAFCLQSERRHRLHARFLTRTSKDNCSVHFTIFPGSHFHCPPRPYNVSHTPYLVLENIKCISNVCCLLTVHAASIPQVPATFGRSVHSRTT